MSIQWVELTDNHLYLEKVFALYEQTFPIEVREPHNIFYRSFQHTQNSEHNHYHLLAGFKGEQLVSFAAGHYFAEANIGFIVYLATAPSFRSKGIGSKTLLQMEKLLNRDAVSACFEELKAVVLETEKEEFVHTRKEKEDCVNRNQFYERNGFKKQEILSYLQPPLQGGENHIPLDLYIKPIQQNEWTKKEVKEMVQVIHQEKYFRINAIEQKVINNGLERMGISKRVSI